MEFFLFLGLALVGAVFYLWRSRVRTSRDIDSLARGMPDDLRDKNTGLDSLPSDGRPWGRGN